MNLQSKNTIFIITLFIFLSAASPLLSQKYAADFLNIGIGARALAMGGSYVAVASDPSAVFWNPAGLAQLNSPEISLMHSSQFSDLLQANFFSFIYPTKSGRTFGLSYFRVGVEDIPMSTKLDEFERPVIEKYFQDLEHAFLFSFANRASEKLLLGGNMKMLYQQVADHSALGFGFDIGAMYLVSSHLYAGACLQDLSGTFIFWDTGTREIRYPNLLLGFSWRQNTPILSGVMLASVGQTFRFEGKNSEELYSIGNIAAAEINFGIEYLMFNTIALRIGRDRENLTAGSGIRFSFLTIDYAFVSHALGNVHRISLDVVF